MLRSRFACNAAMLRNAIVAPTALACALRAQNSAWSSLRYDQAARYACQARSARVVLALLGDNCMEKPPAVWKARRKPRHRDRGRSVI